jgi:hypothetical protein
MTHWKPSHPYLKRFTTHPESKEKLFKVNRQEIEKVFNFEDSKDKPEIRMADIVASSFFRYYCKNEKNISGAVDKMKRQFVLRTGDYTLIKLMNSVNPNAKNPYRDKIDGVSIDDFA